MNPSLTGMRLYDTQDHRLYLIGSERDAFPPAHARGLDDVGFVSIRTLQ